MNEKIYMPVAETNRMNEEEKGFCLYNEMLYEDVDSLVEKYNDKNIYTLNDVKEAFPLMRKLSDKKTYVLLENDLPDIFNE